MNDLVLCFLSYHGDETQFAKRGDQLHERVDV
jgi:hypothetical protein